MQEVVTLTVRSRAFVVRQLVLVSVLLVLASEVSAQRLMSDNSGQAFAWPHPYAYGGFSLNGGGYSLVAGTVGAGLNLDARRLVGLAEFSADNAHKLDSGTGHDIAVAARLFYPIKGGWYFGAGAQWNKLVTIDYSKQAWRPTFGAGKDFIAENFSMRSQVMYILPGTDHLNAVQGPEISLWMPSPATKHHWFWREKIGIYEFHQTSSPQNSGLQNRAVTAFADFTMMYRF